MSVFIGDEWMFCILLQLFQMFCLFVFFNSQDNPKQINNLGEGQAVTVQSECENFNRSFSIPVLKSGLS